MPIIEARGLTKVFRRVRHRPGLSGALLDLFKRQYLTVRAVEEIDLSVQPGETVGYIGPNGAGKSTTIKMLTGILVPSGGHLLVNGMVPHRQRERFVRTIGVVFGHRTQLWWDLAVRESLRLLQRIYRVPEAEHRRHLGEIAGILEMGPFMDSPVRKLSLGQRMRCELAAALLHNPPLVFLDEPTIGLDIVVKQRIRDFLKEINRRYGTTIMLTTHDLSDIEALCPRVVVLDQGRIIYDGSLGPLRQRFASGRRVRVVFTESLPAGAAARIARLMPAACTLEDAFTCLLTIRDPLYPVSEVLQHLPWTVRDIQVLETSMEEIVRRLYQQPPAPTRARLLPRPVAGAGGGEDGVDGLH